MLPSRPFILPVGDLMLSDCPQAPVAVGLDVMDWVYGGFRAHGMRGRMEKEVSLLGSEFI